MKLINKSALVAEIEKRKNKCWFPSEFTNGRKYGLKETIDIINTLEGKEEDLELTWKDMMFIHKCIKDAMNYHISAFGSYEGQKKIYEDVLKRFKAQKGEEV